MCAVKTECQLQTSAKKMQSNPWLFKLLVLCRVHWALNSGDRGLKNGVLMAVFLTKMKKVMG